MTPEERLKKIGLVLPPGRPANGNYVHYRLDGDLLYVAGHGPRIDDTRYMPGRVESDADIQHAYEAARLTGLNILSTVKQAVGELSRVDAILRVFGMVNAASDFKKHSKVIDGCSDIFIEALGEHGRHARTAVGMGSLPHGMWVEVEALFKIK